MVGENYDPGISGKAIGLWDCDASAGERGREGYSGRDEWGRMGGISEEREERCDERGRDRKNIIR